MNTSDVLNKAADLIESRGWGQGGTSWGSDSGLCLEGAIAAFVDINASVARTQFKACPAYRAVWAHLENDTRWGLYRHSLYNWNDTPDRTASEVIEVLRATAVIEAAREQADERVSA